MKKIVKLALFLGCVAAISGLILGFVYSFTEPIIEERTAEAEKASLEVMYPGAEFNTIDYTDESKTIIGVYEAVGKGYVFKATTTGYNSSTPIICMISISNDGVLENVVVLQQQETKGFGSKCFEEENIQNLYIGKTSSDKIDTISSATFTSEAMQKIIAKSFEAYEKVK